MMAKNDMTFSDACVLCSENIEHIMWEMWKSEDFINSRPIRALELLYDASINGQKIPQNTYIIYALLPLLPIWGELRLKTNFRNIEIEHHMKNLMKYIEDESVFDPVRSLTFMKAINYVTPITLSALNKWENSTFENHINPRNWRWLDRQSTKRCFEQEFLDNIELECIFIDDI